MTQMIKVLAADDTQIARAGIERMLGAIPDIQLLGVIDLAQRVVAETKRLSPDVLLIDLKWDDDETAGAAAIGAATEAGAGADEPAGIRLCMYSTICPSVRSVPMCDESTAGSPGACSCTAARISTRLIESIPSSDSMSIESSSIACG